jgi:hypothetical protein
MTKPILSLFLTAAVALGAVGCQTSTGNSALAGGAGGALIGAGIGSLSHQRAGEGALLGGAIGAIGGAIVGNEIDRQNQAGAYYGNGYPPPPPAPVAEPDYGYPPRYGPPVYTRAYYEPRVYYEVHSYRTYGPRHRHYHYRCN